VKYSIIFSFLAILLIFNLPLSVAQNDPDTTPPIILGASILYATTSTNSTIVEFGPIAIDVKEEKVYDVICNPPSGTVFTVGQTTVTCTASDDSGNQSDDFFITIDVTLISDDDSDDTIPDSSSSTPSSNSGTSFTDKYVRPESETIPEEGSSETIDLAQNLVAPKTVIPDWIKNNAKWWVNDEIDDDTFASGIQFLISDNIISIPPTESGVAQPGVSIPEWVKNNAEWWSQGLIDDDTFATSIQFLIKEGILTV